jgi:hypothetical protein
LNESGQYIHKIELQSLSHLNRATLLVYTSEQLV